MYATKYVKKRVRRLAVLIGGGVSATVVGVFSIVAFLGRFVGTFTVSLDSADVKLALCDSRSFENPESFLHVDALPDYNETTFTSLPNFSMLDSEEMDSLAGANYNPNGEIDSIRFFKYTFYVKNVGNVSAQYKTTIKIIDSTPTEENQPRYLNDTIRVMLFENYDDIPDAHAYTVYAKRRAIAYIGEDASVVWKEPISIREDQVTPNKPFQGYAEEFESDTVIATTTTRNFDIDEIKRYTLVTWLEGNDAQSSPLLAPPKGATLKLGVEINAYEN